MNDDDFEELAEIAGVALADGVYETEIARRLYAAGFRRPGQPTAAQVEAAAQAMSLTIHQIALVWEHMKPADREVYREAARAALAATINPIEQ